MAPGTERTGEPRGRAGRPSPPAGCAGLLCQARSDAVPCGVRYGRACSCVESGRGAPLSLLFLSFVVLLCLVCLIYSFPLFMLVMAIKFRILDFSTVCDHWCVRWRDQH